MASKNPLLPTRPQCNALTDAQCRQIQDLLDPDGTRKAKDWELSSQNDLIRLYMTGMSFPQIESAMAPRLTWSYKTYSNRFHDWKFPANPVQRDNKIIELYTTVVGSTPSNPAMMNTPPASKPLPPQQRGPQPRQPLPQLPQLSTKVAKEGFSPYEQSGRSGSGTPSNFAQEVFNSYEQIGGRSNSYEQNARSGSGTPQYDRRRSATHEFEPTSTPFAQEVYTPEVYTPYEQVGRSASGTPQYDPPLYDHSRSNTHEFNPRNSISTINTFSSEMTWVSSSSASIFSTTDFASHRDSIATTSSLMSLQSEGQNPSISLAAKRGNPSMSSGSVRANSSASMPSNHGANSSFSMISDQQSPWENIARNRANSSMSIVSDRGNTSASLQSNQGANSAVGLTSDLPISNPWENVANNRADSSMGLASVSSVSLPPELQRDPWETVISNPANSSMTLVTNRGIPSTSPVTTRANATIGVASDSGDSWANLSNTLVNSSVGLASDRARSINNDISERASPSTSLATHSPYANQPKPLPIPQRRLFKPPRHDPEKGEWNGSLRVIPCRQNHSTLDPHKPFERCNICGFTQRHALMIHARGMDIDTFAEAMDMLGATRKRDYVGNSPLHFLMCAGVSMPYFACLINRINSTSQNDFGQNSFGQNPLHVLNPQDLGDDLIRFLEWFVPRKPPPGLLLTQRDIWARTPLHCLLQHPLPKESFHKIVQVFPMHMHQLRSLNTSGHSTIQMMNAASLRMRAESETSYRNIQDRIVDVQALLAESPESADRKYGFSDIAKGARGLTFQGIDSSDHLFECRICGGARRHTNSYVDQMKCANAYGIDPNAPDETGLTPAHAIVTKERSNENRGHETPEQTEELFRILIPQNEKALSAAREALHVLDPEGNTLVHNLAVRGFDGLLKYVLELEPEGRRTAMVNAVSRDPHGKMRSVLEAVYEKLRELNDKLYIHRKMANKEMVESLKTKGEAITRCKQILKMAGASQYPSVTKRWRIAD